MSKKSDESIVAVDHWRANVAAVLVDDGGRVLLGVAGNHSPYYHFPQGGVRRGETMREAVLRELGEETGLPCDGVRVVARYGGLRYRYRSKNRKRERWEGQEQTYFLLRWPGLFPENLKATGPEFVRLLCLPWQELEPALFVPFKQEVATAVLEHFFPAHLREGECTPAEIEAYWALACRTARYLSRSGQRPQLLPAPQLPESRSASLSNEARPGALPPDAPLPGAFACPSEAPEAPEAPACGKAEGSGGEDGDRGATSALSELPICDADDDALFGGGKEEAEGFLADAQRELQQLQRAAAKRGEALIVLALGPPGSGRRGLLRQIGRCLDPLRLAVGRARPEHVEEALTERLDALNPEPGTVVLLLNSPYDTLMRDEQAAAEWSRSGSLTPVARQALESLEQAEQRLRERGLRVLHLFLNEPSSASRQPQKTSPSTRGEGVDGAGHDTEAPASAPDGDESESTRLAASCADPRAGGCAEYFARELDDSAESFGLSGDGEAAAAEACDEGSGEDAAKASERRVMFAWASRLMEERDWLLLPSSRRWYRNLVAVRAVAEALGSP